ncbi:MAG: hypothetical protein R3C49_14315 [Planctomycetaceae bacterium]
MTAAAAFAWTVVRCLCVASVALPLSATVHRLLMGASAAVGGRRSKRLLWISALLPLFVPDLLTGFTWRLTAARMVHSAVATELFYATLLLLKAVALQTVIRLLIIQPPDASPSVYCWQLLPGRSIRWWLTWLRLNLTEFRLPTVVAWLGSAVMCLQEFEIAALVQIDRHPIVFSVWLFDAHAAGEPLRRSVMLMLPALIWQTCLLVPVILLVRSSGDRELNAAARTPSIAKGVHRSDLVFGGLFLLTAVWMTMIQPFAANAAELFSGLKEVINSRSAGTRFLQIASSIFSASLAAGSSLVVVMLLRRFRRTDVVTCCVLPGLSGPLVLSLLVLAAFQLPVLRVLYDTWAPLLVGQTLWLLPRTLLLVLVLERFAPATSVHCAILQTGARRREVAARAEQLVWELRWRGWLLAFVLLAHWCLWDVTTASILRSVRFEPVVTRLYGEMHYGRSEVLVAITALTLLLPFAGLLAVTAVLSRLVSWRKR